MRFIRNCVPFFCAPGNARFLRAQVPNPPGSGKDIAEGKGVAGDCKSEGSRIREPYGRCCEGMAASHRLLLDFKCMDDIRKAPGIREF